MPEALTNAVALHRAGQWSQAAHLYQQILDRDPQQVDALHLLGVLRHQQADHAAAIELIGKAITLRPNVSDYHVNLAEAYRVAGHLDHALDFCRTALRLSPGDAEAHLNLGLILRGLGRHSEAADAFQSALKLRPNFALAHRNLAISLRDLDRRDVALTHFRRAVELAPNDAQAHDCLGQMLTDLGKPDEALPHCHEAVRLRPNLAALHHNLGNALLALGQNHQAKGAYSEAIRLDPHTAQACAGLGLALHQEGKLADALAWLKRAVELEPDEGIFWEYLAELHKDCDDHAEAIARWRRALALNPNRAAVHYNFARLLQTEGHSDEAEQRYRSALRLDPGMAEAHLGLAGLREERGELIEAESAMREALRVKPAYAIPYGRLATLLKGRLPEADCAALQAHLADSRLSRGHRAQLLFGMAYVLDARGDYPEAAACLKEANALTLEHRFGRKPVYDAAEHANLIGRVIQGFSPAFFARTAGMGVPTRRPVFVFGLQRSGTTLVEQILASHSQVHGAGELRLARQSLNAIPLLLHRNDPPLECLGSLDAATIQRLAQQHESQLTALADDNAERIVDKMPDNYVFLGLLATLFPNAAFIHCRRDLRDVAVSCWMTDFHGIRWANDIDQIAGRFQQYCRLMDHWRTVLPVPMLDVNYEETVADLEGVARRLIDWCGLAWEPACLRFHETRRSIRTASVTQVRQPIYKGSVGRWRNYERELAELFAKLPTLGFEM